MKKWFSKTAKVFSWLGWHFAAVLMAPYRGGLHPCIGEHKAGQRVSITATVAEALTDSCHLGRDGKRKDAESAMWSTGRSGISVLHLSSFMLNQFPFPSHWLVMLWGLVYMSKTGQKAQENSDVVVLNHLAHKRPSYVQTIRLFVKNDWLDVKQQPEATRGRDRLKYRSVIQEFRSKRCGVTRKWRSQAQTGSAHHQKTVKYIFTVNGLSSFMFSQNEMFWTVSIFSCGQ